MNLELPTVSTTLGPEWATALNAALETVDEHDHTSGKGKPIPISGLNFNANVNFEEFKAYNLKQTQFVADLVATLTGASNAGSVYMFEDNLYFTNGSGTAVQLTAGSAPVTTPGTFQTLEVETLAGDLTISPSDTFVQINVDTSAPRTVTLPAASAVAEGRVYYVKDVTGQAYTNVLTITPNGADTIDEEVTLAIDSDFAGVWLSSDGVSNWAIL
jgi:hypothetical protein